MKRPALSGPAAALVGLLVAFNVAVGAAFAAGVRVNLTSSMPAGLYRVRHASVAELRRDSVVAVCPGIATATVAAARRYLAPGACPGNVEPLLKHIAAVAGDTVDVSDRATLVNGTALANSGRVARDCAGRPLARIGAGRLVIPPGRVWLYAPVARSWDSRYFGPQPVAGVIGVATPVLVVGTGSACR